MSEQKTNTKTKGELSFLFFQENEHVVGVCLEFNIVEEGKTFFEVQKNLHTAVVLHLQTVQEKNLSDELLNRHAPKEYWNMYKEVTHRKQIETLMRKRRILQKTSTPYDKRLSPALFLQTT